MGVPNSEVGYTPAMPRREDHEVHKGHVVALEEKNILQLLLTGFLVEVHCVFLDMRTVSPEGWRLF
jgi:hypothetical protein